MQNMLNGIMMESLQSNNANIEMNTGSGADIDQIMMEASAVAEQNGGGQPALEVGLR